MCFSFLCFFFALLVVPSLTLTWNQDASMIQARSDFVAITVGGKVYIMGGCITNQTISDNACQEITAGLSVYDLLNNAWSTLTPAPRQRYRYAAAAVGNKIYYVGGRYINDSIVEEVDVYDTVSGSWSTLPPQGGVTTYSDGAAFVLGYHIYVSGGYDLNYGTSNSTVVLDTSITGAAAGLFQPNLVPTKRVSSGDNGAIGVGNYGYVFGGWGYVDNGQSSFCIPLANMERYDPITNQWTMLQPFLHGRGDMAYTSIGDYIFVVGGETKDSSCTVSVPNSEVEIYSITGDSWRDITPIAITRFRFSGASYGTDIYDFGGQGAVQNNQYYPVLADVYSLDVLQFVQDASGQATSCFGGVVVFGLFLVFLV